MATEEYDLVTIGAGSGGVRASRFAAQYYNAKVAVVELPFGFVSSDDIGGGDAAVRYVFVGLPNDVESLLLLAGAQLHANACLHCSKSTS